MSSKFELDYVLLLSLKSKRVLRVMLSVCCIGIVGKYIVGFSIVRCLIQSSHPSDPAVGVILCVFLGGCVLFYDPELVV